MNPAVALPGSELRLCTARASGARYRVALWRPEGAAPPGGWPVLYVLDGNALFATFVEAVRRSSRRPDATGVLPMAVAGIAPDDDALFAEPLRRRDFTQRAGFLEFLVDELAPALRAEGGVDPARQALFGHSLAGYFVLEALAARPAAFAHWIAVSPSVWWDEAGLRARLAASLPGRAGPRVFVAAGAWEDEVPPWQRQQPGLAQLVERRAQRQMVARAQALAGDIAGWLGPQALRWQLFADEDHASVVMVAAQRALRFVSGAA